MSQTSNLPGVRGGCLCGALRYRVTGPLRHVVICHCKLCRRAHTHLGAYSACAPDDLHFDQVETLEWFQSSLMARRGFCNRCGSALFWAPTDGGHISISAGSLDDPTGLVIDRHICTEEKGDYYSID